MEFHRIFRRFVFDEKRRLVVVLVDSGTYIISKEAVSCDLVHFARLRTIPIQLEVARTFSYTTAYAHDQKDYLKIMNGTGSLEDLAAARRRDAGEMGHEKTARQTLDADKVSGIIYTFSLSGYFVVLSPGVWLSVRNATYVKTAVDDATCNY